MYGTVFLFLIDLDSRRILFTEIVSPDTVSVSTTLLPNRRPSLLKGPGTVIIRYRVVPFVT